MSSEVWGDGVARKRMLGKIHSENKVLEPSAIPLSCQQSHSPLLCRIRLSPKTAEAFREGCAPILPLQAPSPGQAPWRHAPLKPSPLGPGTSLCTTSGPSFHLGSTHLDCMFQAPRTWRGTAVTMRKVQLAFPSLLPPGADPSVKLQN